MFIFQKVEDDVWRNVIEHHLQQNNIKILFSMYFSVFKVVCLYMYM